MLLRLFVLLIVATWLSTWLGTGSALAAEKRVALVMGNSAYKNVGRLANPANDAALVGDMFRKAGFDSVDIKLDLDVAGMRKALRDFGGKAREADVAVVYYAGHGIELDGTNYLIPTDATLETDSDVLDETLPLDRALFAVEAAKQLRLVILDACRDNPFAKTMKRTIAARAIGRGLAKVEPTSPNTMIAFAAKAGSTASDGDAKNSPFATALVERLPMPGLDLRKAFGFVRDDVLKTTGYKQEPYVYGSLGGDDVPLVAAKPAVAGPQANPQDAVRRDYELALQLGTRDGWSAFLDSFPSGFYSELAKGQLKKIAAEETRAAAAEKARQAEDEKARLANDRAKKAEQDKAAAAAKAAEDARIAAEKAKQIEDAKAAAAEQRRKDAEACAAEKSAAAVKSDKLAENEQKVAASKSSHQCNRACLRRRQRSWFSPSCAASAVWRTQPMATGMRHRSARWHCLTSMPARSSMPSWRASKRSTPSRPSRAGSARSCAITASRPMATLASRSPAVPAIASMTTMNAKRCRTRSRLRPARMPKSETRSGNRLKLPLRSRLHPVKCFVATRAVGR